MAITITALKCLDSDAMARSTQPDILGGKVLNNICILKP